MGVHDDQRVGRHHMAGCAGRCILTKPNVDDATKRAAEQLRTKEYQKIEYESHVELLCFLLDDVVETRTVHFEVDRWQEEREDLLSQKRECRMELNRKRRERAEAAKEERRRKEEERKQRRGRGEGKGGREGEGRGPRRCCCGVRGGELGRWRGWRGRRVEVSNSGGPG